MDHVRTATDAATQTAPAAADQAIPDRAQATDPGPAVVFDVEGLTVSYGGRAAVRDVDLAIHQHEITAIIGPSGCGKSTLLRCFNRMNDLVPAAQVQGKVTYHGQDLYARDVDPVEVRRRVGMVFQKPNPFPKSIYDNIAFGPKVNAMRVDLDEIVERSLKRAALWDEVKSKLRDSAYSLSGGQQQRLCIARAIAVDPDVILMDEPCSALDPVATARIEDLMRELKEHYTIVIVTHNMQQAARASDVTAFLTMGDDRAGYLVEMAETQEIFTRPTSR
ncbi:MAG: phosphate ABC transporter ATP-binding protein PstB, partial [Actinomycetota bacterium]|nr:phosphate ABC transporter ATP-binding protein PstB [Actinomycetota bacterium]